jgi:hypothetical protein
MTLGEQSVSKNFSEKLFWKWGVKLYLRSKFFWRIHFKLLLKLIFLGIATLRPVQFNYTLLWYHTQDPSVQFAYNALQQVYYYFLFFKIGFFTETKIKHHVVVVCNRIKTITFCWTFILVSHQNFGELLYYWIITFIC